MATSDVQAKSVVSTHLFSGYLLAIQYWIVLAVLVRSVVFDHPNGSGIRASEKAVAHKRLGQPEAEMETGVGDGHSYCRK